MSGETERYSRQILFKGFGERGQARLKTSRVLVAGVGGLGSPVAMYLVASGIGKITLVDSDTVALSNLNRQILHWERDVGREKVVSAQEKLVAMNSKVKIHSVRERITPASCEIILEDDVQVVVDCLDTLVARHVLNEACVKMGIPLVHGGVYGMMGQLTTIVPGRTPCLACLFPRKEEGKPLIPVFGPTAGFIASLQALEVIKFLSGVGKNLLGKLLYFNGETMECMLVDVSRKKDCAICGHLV